MTRKLRLQVHAASYLQVRAASVPRAWHSSCLFSLLFSFLVQEFSEVGVQQGARPRFGFPVRGASRTTRGVNRMGIQIAESERYRDREREREVTVGGDTASPVSDRECERTNCGSDGECSYTRVVRIVQVMRGFVNFLQVHHGYRYTEPTLLPLKGKKEDHPFSGGDTYTPLLVLRSATAIRTP